MGVGWGCVPDLGGDDHCYYSMMEDPFTSWVNGLRGPGVGG